MQSELYLTQEKVFVIAEAGVNHNGKVALAKKMIEAAADSGADAIKFQTFDPGRLVTRKSPLARYQKRGEKKRTQYEMLKSLQLSRDALHSLMDYCGSRGIIFLSSCFDIQGAEFLYKLGLGVFKIPSGEVTDLPLLRKIGSFKKTLIVSSGMATLNEVRVALSVLVKSGTPKKNIYVLHCNTAYPTPYEDVNLRAMITMKEKLGVAVGYSDHTRGPETALAAVALGARIIEKHFTLDRNFEGPDHMSSMEAKEFRSLVICIRNVEKAMGDGIKKPTASESENIPVVRKSIVASRNIRGGDKFTTENLTIKRPGSGLSPMCWDRALGRIAKRNFQKDEYIEL
jgi:N,N'-diacetyllegionaminate synthase